MFLNFQGMCSSLYANQLRLSPPMYSHREFQQDCQKSRTRFPYGFFRCYSQAKSFVFCNLHTVGELNHTHHIGLPQIMNKHMQQSTGRPMDIPPGVEAMILMAPMAEEGYKPLYQLNDYYEPKDLEGIFHVLYVHSIYTFNPHSFGGSSLFSRSIPALSRRDLIICLALALSRRSRSFCDNP